MGIYLHVHQNGIYKFLLFTLMKGVPILIIGHHVMYGKIINLEKPMVLMQKVRKAANRQVLMDEDELTSQKIETEPESTKDQTKLKTEYVVKAIIRKKILFNKRPRPIVY